jgi:hypothetical protein
LTAVFIEHAGETQLKLSISSSSSSSYLLSNKPLAGPWFTVSSSGWFGELAEAVNANKGLQQLRSLVQEVEKCSGIATSELCCSSSSSSSTVQRCRKLVAAVLTAAGDAVDHLLQQQRLTIVMLQAVINHARMAEVYCISLIVAHTQRVLSDDSDVVALRETLLFYEVYACVFSRGECSCFSSIDSTQTWDQRLVVAAQMAEVVRRSSVASEAAQQLASAVACSAESVSSSSSGAATAAAAARNLHWRAFNTPPAAPRLGSSTADRSAAAAAAAAADEGALGAAAAAGDTSVALQQRQQGSQEFVRLKYATRRIAEATAQVSC